MDGAGPEYLPNSAPMNSGAWRRTLHLEAALAEFRAVEEALLTETES